MLGRLSFKLRVFLAKQVSKDFMHSFLKPDVPRKPSFQHRATPSSSTVLGLSQVVDGGSQHIRRLFTDRMSTHAMTKLRGEGPSSLFLQSPKYFPDDTFVTLPILGCPSLEESYPSLANQSSPWATEVEVGSVPAEKITLVSLVAYGPKVFLLSLSLDGLQLLKPVRAVPNTRQLRHVS